jgi:putative membrane protein
VRKDNADSIKIFFLACIVIAGVFGALTAKTSILFVQGLPALVALLLVIFNQRKAT